MTQNNLEPVSYTHLDVYKRQDRVVRTEDTEAAARALHELGKIMPTTMSFLDRAQIQAGSLLGRKLPKVVVPAARARIRQMVDHMIVDAVSYTHLDGYKRQRSGNGPFWRLCALYGGQYSGGPTNPASGAV